MADAVCSAGHRMPAGPGRVCTACRRKRVIARVAAVAPSLSTPDIAAAVDAVATNHAVWRSLATALESGSEALTTGAPPAVGRLVTELIARGAALPVPDRRPDRGRAVLFRHREGRSALRPGPATTRQRRRLGDAEIRGEMHRRMLGNGYCARPVEMDCHFESICESCSFFVTTIEFRPTLQAQRNDAAHKGHVARTKIYDGLLERLDTDAS